MSRRLWEDVGQEHAGKHGAPARGSFSDSSVKLASGGHHRHTPSRAVPFMDINTTCAVGDMAVNGKNKSYSLDKHYTCIWSRRRENGGGEGDTGALRCFLEHPVTACL